ncbi:pyridoxamine 5'-phosphate oxidase family protein [Pseudalkalibacillus sp. A8]|uniref:pyridoxamine 5'-phosphate oxidase family protein n=1 Tax=Pseudalkalibacillus sp. A8 TaxID=3382641 RepID=UPI0038B61065
MNTIRYAKRECKDPEKINSFLAQAKTGFLGLSAREQPYVIPLNFVWWDNKIYFHGAAEGRKIEMINDNSNICFTISEEYSTIVSPIPAHTDTAYMSVIMFGNIELVTDLEEGTQAMQEMLDKYVPGYYDTPLAKSHVEKYTSSMGSKTAIYKIIPRDVTAKENELVEKNHFYPGRSVKGDRVNNR